MLLHIAAVRAAASTPPLASWRRPPRRRVAPHEPLVLLCIAAALLNQAATKRVPNRHRAVLQAFAFLQEYGDARWAPLPDHRCPSSLWASFCSLFCWLPALMISMQERCTAGPVRCAEMSAYSDARQAADQGWHSATPGSMRTSLGMRLCKPRGDRFALQVQRPGGCLQPGAGGAPVGPHAHRCPLLRASAGDRAAVRGRRHSRRVVAAPVVVARCCCSDAG